MRYKLNITESNFKKLLIGESENDETTIKLLKNLLKRSEVMKNKENEKLYYCYYLESISSKIGRKLVMSVLDRNGRPYGQISIKPLNIFEKTYIENNINNN